MAALPYMQMYWGDYYADTPHLTTEQHGAYLLLIAAYWQRGKRIPKNQLASISKLNERWTDVEPMLNEFFTVDETGCWVHERIEQELAKVKSKSVKASAAGKASAAKRAKAQLESNERSTDVEPKLQPETNHTEAEADTEVETTTTEQPWLLFENRLTEIGLNPITLATKHRPQLQQWHKDGVGIDEFNLAIADATLSLANQNRTDPPSVKYIAKVIEGNRIQALPISAGKKTKPRLHRQVESTDPLGSNTAAYEAKAAAELEMRMNKHRSQPPTQGGR